MKENPEFPESLIFRACERWPDFELQLREPEDIDPLCAADTEFGYLGATWSQDGQSYEITVEFSRRPTAVHWAHLASVIRRTLDGERVDPVEIVR